MNVQQKLADMGLEVPEVAAPVAAYIPGVRTGNLFFTSGQLPTVGGELKYTGHVGSEVSPEDAYQAARIACLNCLGVIRAEVGDLSRVRRVVKVTGFVSSDPDFTEQPQVVNGASELLLELFGDKGKHARAAVGMANLPLGAPVEVEMIVEVE
ncbi:MAG: RidA family protein [Bacillota bacterium]